MAEKIALDSWSSPSACLRVLHRAEGVDDKPVHSVSVADVSHLPPCHGLFRYIPALSPGPDKEATFSGPRIRAPGSYQLAALSASPSDPLP
ncbi:unnamed protein product [Arctogadus glacialis]